MSEVDSSVAPSTASSEVIFDGDFHVQVPMEELLPYVEDEVIHDMVERHGPPGGISGGKKGAYASNISQQVEGQSGATIHGQAYTADDVLKVKNEMDLDYVFVTPTPRGSFWGSAKYPKIKKELIRAWNDYTIDNIIDVENGIYSSIMFPRWDVEDSIEELDRVGTEDGVIGIGDWLSFEEPFGSIKYDPFFEKLISLGKPLVMHSAGEYLDRRSPIGEYMHTQTELMIASTALQAIGTTLNMIVTGVFDKYPELDVVIQEAGTNWIPYVAYQADELYQVYGEDIQLNERLRELDQNSLNKMPSDYLFENFYVTTQPIALPKKTQDADGLLKASHAEDMFIFSTDWPHGSLDTPDWVFDSNAINSDLRSKILNENASKVFNF